MRRSPSTAAVLVVLVLAGGVLPFGGVADGARAPKIAVYDATIDVAGFVTVRAFQDTTQECEQGRDVAIDYTDDFELGKPRKVTVSAAFGTTFSGQARRPGGVVHEGKVVNYTETNNCPPTTPVTPGKPECSKHRGTLRASLVPTPDVTDDEDLTPLVRDVSIALQRTGGGNQAEECFLGSMLSLKAKLGKHVVTTLSVDGTMIVLPLGATDASFRKLRKGKAIRRVIRLNGACDGVLISSGQAEGRAAGRLRAAPRSSCTVTGKIFVSVRRVG